MATTKCLRIVILLWCCFACTVHASDYAREKKWADEVVPGIVVGEPVYLEADHHPFLSIHTPVKHSSTAVIIVHGLGCPSRLGHDRYLANRVGANLYNAGNTDADTG